ncbi:extracellular catalytic domain type 1 short-chain-length polyhydroxyalkanoate depolymerase [Thalassotalea piscium]|uniref:Poly(Hydroxyalkanoate) depolymerase family esterase n=1 Tax=Thalassotalea piscium TaxID=1230533 RepID=A0A7X0NFR7_9GAMM|nr:PHB depolymerase family esterase [Thalassotalea piscium]MBB6542634.1 poly(hydroxyalkanoate) depolymerase family esterase [Thalassotalea piscium]
MRLLSKTLLISLLATFVFTSQAVLAKFTSLTNFGDNPGELTASYYPSKSDNLVVLLHGCVQNGEELAEQSGFLGLAKSNNFTLLVPQQNENNNIKTCFNWFSPQDIDKDQGETLSLKNMILHTKAETKAENVYIVGLSAGGAMASVMLVNYPELFESGAIIAGVPFPCANNLIKAIACMRSGPSQTPTELTDLVQKANPKQQNWPTLTIWTGNEDKVVHPLNSHVLAQHWAILNQITSTPVVERKQGYQISKWLDQENNARVKLIEIEDMGHGISVNPTAENGGKEAAFIIKAPLAAAKSIVNYWKLN